MRITISMLFACILHVATAQVQDTTKAPGSSIEKAIYINQKNETKGVADEYKWLDAQYPGYKKMGQETIFKDGHPYDLVHIRTAEGKKMDVYYDIIKFYGKF